MFHPDHRVLPITGGSVVTRGRKNVRMPPTTIKKANDLFLLPIDSIHELPLASKRGHEECGLQGRTISEIISAREVGARNRGCAGNNWLGCCPHSERLFATQIEKALEPRGTKSEKSSRLCPQAASFREYRALAGASLRLESCYRQFPHLPLLSC